MNTRRLIEVFFIILAGVFLFFYLQDTQSSLFFYREQQQIFLNDWDYVQELMHQFGGLNIAFSQSLIQFFTIPFMGSAVTSILSVITAFFLWLTIRKLGGSLWLLPVVLLATFTPCAYLLNMGYHYEALTATMEAVMLIWVYALIADYLGWKSRTVMGILFTLFLYYTAGSIATLFTLTVWLYDILKRHSYHYASVIYVVLLFIIAWRSVDAGAVNGFASALWVDGYTDYQVRTDFWLCLSWILTLCAFPLAWIRHRILDKISVQIALGVVLLVIGGWYVSKKVAATTDKDFVVLTALMHHINNEDAESIIHHPGLNTKNYLHLNCLNWALSYKGTLLTDLFKYPQKGSQSIIAGYQAYNDVNVLFSHIYYRMGIVSEAMCLAFGTMIATPYGNPTMLKQLIKERLIFGDYDVAEKYITRLERTYAYKDWAKNMRRFLYNDEVVNNDPELGMKRCDLPQNQSKFVVVDGIMNDLMTVIDTRSNDPHTFEYAVAMLLLDKNLAGIKILVETIDIDAYKDKMPVLLQEAIITYSENDEDYCRSHGVAEETMTRFKAFRQKALDARHSGQNQSTALASYRGSFWYYYMFV